MLRSALTRYTRVVPLAAALLLAACATGPQAGPGPAAPITELRPWAEIEAAITACVDAYWSDAAPADCQIAIADRTDPELLGRGLNLVWTGRVPDAREYLEQLQEQGVPDLLVLLLDIDILSAEGKQRALAERLTAARSLVATGAVPAAMLDRYDASHLAAESRNAQVLEHLSRMDADEVAGDRFLLAGYVDAATALLEVERAQAMLDRVGDPAVLRSAEYLRAHYEVASLRGEEREFDTYVIEGVDTVDNINLRQSRLTARLMREYDGRCASACDELIDLLAQRPWDVPRALRTAKLFALLREPDHVMRALAAAPASQREIEALGEFARLQAWLAVMEGEAYQSMLLAQRVLVDAPRDADAHLVQAMVARVWDDADTLAASLAVLRDVSPINGLFLAQWSETENLHEDAALCRLAREWSAQIAGLEVDWVRDNATALEDFARACTP